MKLGVIEPEAWVLQRGNSGKLATRPDLCGQLRRYSFQMWLAQTFNLFGYGSRGERPLPNTMTQKARNGKML